MFSLISERKLGDRRRSGDSTSAFEVEEPSEGAEAAVYLVVNSESSSVLTPGPHHQTVGAPLRMTHSQALPRSLQTERWWAGL